MHVLQVWDANLGQAACSFTFPDRVFGVAMSAAAATHCLIAVVGGDPHVKLCDPATGGFTHSLVGHREPVWAVTWSLDCEYHLVTGGCGGQVSHPPAIIMKALAKHHTCFCCAGHCSRLLPAPLCMLVSSASSMIPSCQWRQGIVCIPIPCSSLSLLPFLA